MDGCRSIEDKQGLSPGALLLQDPRALIGLAFPEHISLLKALCFPKGKSWVKKKKYRGGSCSGKESEEY